MNVTNASGRGMLVAIGTGLRIVGQLTVESIGWMRRADRLLYVVGDPVAETVLQELNPTGAESLLGLYVDGKPRSETYAAMAERALVCVRKGELTCFVTYGHPGFFANPIHQALRRARAEGFETKLLPGISTLDCLFADLEIDPAVDGFQSFDATDFLRNERSIDPTAGLVLWQIGVLGDPCYRAHGYDRSRHPALVERLAQFHSPDHVVQVYQSASLPWSEPAIRAIPLHALPETELTPYSTLYVPPTPSISPTRGTL